MLVYIGLYKDLKLLQKKKEKALDLEDEQSSAKGGETKGELCVLSLYMYGDGVDNYNLHITEF